MAHEDYREMLAARALDALDETDVRAVDAHLANCAECRAELEEWRDTAGLLAHGALPVEPRAEVGARIMDQVSGGLAPSAETPANVVTMQPRSRAPANPWSNLLRLAASIAFVALLLGTLVLWMREIQFRGHVARLTRETETQQRELTRDREALALLTAPDAKRMEMAGTEQAKMARGTFAFDRQNGRAVLLTEGLPATPADKAYELWFIADGHPLRGKVFTVDASGRAMMSDQVPPEAREHAVFAITLEPKGGVSAPTGAIYLSSPSS